MTEWIACSERMPERGQLVAFVAFGETRVGYYKPERRPHEWVWDDMLDVDMCGDCAHYTADSVTHWMPLPEPPK